VDAFRENLEDLERQVADAAAEAQQLERCTTEAVSLEVRGAPDWVGGGGCGGAARAFGPQVFQWGQQQQQQQQQRRRPASPPGPKQPA
jgi:hypothetical protein